MIFLIEYDRARGHVVQQIAFSDERLSDAENARLALELSLNQRRIDHEVVLLQAASEEALRKTHRRYFESMAGLPNRKVG
jgi:hypothetical protein